MSRRGRSGVVHYKNESEFSQAQKKAGVKPQGQSIKTYYSPKKPASNVTDANEKEREGLKHHEERRELNRSIRSRAHKNLPLREKVHDALGGVGRRIGPMVQKVGPALENMNRGGGGGGGMGLNIKPPKDIGFSLPNFAPPDMGMGFPGGMMGGMGMSEPEPEHRPRRRNRNRRRAPARESSGQNWQDIGGVPPEVRKWMM